MKEFSEFIGAVISIGLIIVAVIFLMDLSEEEPVINSTSSISSGSVRLDRTRISGGFGWALVTYTNNTTLTFDSVEVQCVVFDYNGNKICADYNCIYGDAEGLVKPGWKETTDIRLRLGDETMSYVKCYCRGDIKYAK